MTADEINGIDPLTPWEQDDDRMAVLDRLLDYAPPSTPQPAPTETPA